MKRQGGEGLHEGRMKSTFRIQIGRGRVREGWLEIKALSNRDTSIRASRNNVDGPRLQHSAEGIIVRAGLRGWTEPEGSPC